MDVFGLDVTSTLLTKAHIPPRLAYFWVILLKMLMTGKGGIQYDRAEAYRTFDRACRGGHGGACHLQAQILCSPAGELGPGVPHNPRKAMQLYQKVCDDGDSLSCFTLAGMLLRGDKVSKEADNVSPQEARGAVPLEKRTNEPDRSRKADDTRPIPRDPKRAEKLLLRACINGSHATSCHNLAVMYTHGDDGVPADPQKAEEFQKKTDDMVRQFGGFF
jgi:TPR repeat protein